MFAKRYTENEILDLELKYKNNDEVMQLIATVKGRWPDCHRLSKETYQQTLEVDNESSE